MPVSDVELHAPVPHPGKILGIGLNYQGHIAETGGNKPTTQIGFNKQTVAASGPCDKIAKPSVSDTLDYEGELVFVIGKWAKHVPPIRGKQIESSPLAAYGDSLAFTGGNLQCRMTSRNALREPTTPCTVCADAQSIQGVSHACTNHASDRLAGRAFVDGLDERERTGTICWRDR